MADCSSQIVTFREATEQSAKLHDDPAFYPDFSELVDFNGASEVQMGYEDFRSLLAIDPFSASSKRAFVISSRNSVYGTARMYQIMRGDEACVEIFKTIADAARWLASTADPTG